MGLRFLSKQVHRQVRVHAKEGTLPRFVNLTPEEDLRWRG